MSYKYKLTCSFGKYILSLFLVLYLFSSCKKYLDEKPLKTTVIPSTLNDLQAVLNRYDIINENGPELLEALSDNYYITSSTWNSFPVNDRMNYVWDKGAVDYNNWYFPYTNPVYYANVVIDQLPRIQFMESERPAYDLIKGSALFYRAFTFYQLAQQFCLPYSANAGTDPGIVMRLTSDINVPSQRSTVQQTYDQITDDLKQAAYLLPATTTFPTIPNKVAALGALARTYLSMRDYVHAGTYADSALRLYSSLLNYNTISTSNYPIFPRFNKEIIYYSKPYGSTLVSGRWAIIDSSLYQSYSANDLRRELFFADNGDNTYSFQGSYQGSDDFWVFDGIATDELYLIRAECAARAGTKDAALADLNTLLQTRWKASTFLPFTTATANEALALILTERRKELIYRGLRWTDLRRLNLEGANIMLKRIIDNTTYTLPPNDLRYTLLIPQEVLKLTKLAQNPR